MKRIVLLALLCLVLGSSIAQDQMVPSRKKRNSQPHCSGKPMVIPSPAQIKWQEMEMNMFCHFGPNTFTGEEWGNGMEREDLFNPTQLDCNQWVAVAKAAGMKGIIITAKHHDGFCLWPSKESNHTVRESSWRNGQGDVLRELSEACKKGGLKFGVYVSPWDRNAPTYGTPEYNDVFVRTLQEVHSQYGDVFEQWFDGACGEGPNGKKQVYDFYRFNRAVLDIHPNSVIFSDVGPGCRWMGNESGVMGRTSWSMMNIWNPEGAPYEPGTGVPSQEILNTGEPFGKTWVPAETDVSIRPGWFYRDSEHPKSLQQLLSIYYTSVGRNSLLLLNVPPDKRGLIAEEDSIRLVEFRAALDSIFLNDLSRWARIRTSTGRSFNINRWKKGEKTSLLLPVPPQNQPIRITIRLQKPTSFNRLMLQEDISRGQLVSHCNVWVKSKGEKNFHPVAEATTIGYKRILLIDQQTDVVEVMLELESLYDCYCIALSNFALFQDNIFDASNLLEKTVGRTTDVLIP